MKTKNVETELSKMSNMCIEILSLMDVVDYYSKDIEDIIRYLGEFYVYDILLIINQFDLYPVARKKQSVYFLFNGKYFALNKSKLPKDLSDYDIKVDKSFEIMKLSEETGEQFKHIILQNECSVVMTLVTLFEDIDFNVIVDFMIDEVAGNSAVKNTLEEYRNNIDRISKYLSGISV